MTMELCRPCAEKRKKKGQRLVLAYHGVNEKITCADCQRRRYGAKYNTEGYTHCVQETDWLPSG